MTKMDNYFISLRSSIKPDPSWKQRAKAALVVYAQREGNQKEIVSSTVYTPWPKYAAALFALLILILVPRTLAAAHESRPGHFLYPFKLLGEKVRFAVASDEIKPQVKVTVSLERTRELESSLVHDPEKEQLAAVKEVEKARDDIDSLREEIRYDTYRRVKEQLIKIKESAKHERVKKRLDEIIVSLDERLGIPETTPTPTPGNNSMSVSPSPSRAQTGFGNNKSEVHVETINGYTQVIINGKVVVSLAPTQDNAKIEVKVEDTNVKVMTKSNVDSHTSLNLESDDSDD